MLKFIGAAVVVGGIAFGAAVGTGLVSFKADAEVTPKGKQQVQELRKDLADHIRGDATARP